MNEITRFIQKQIKSDLFKGKVVTIYGPRQVGKTTLVRSLIKDSTRKTQYFNCDEPDIRTSLANKTSTELKQLIGSAELVVFDEAQRVENIGITLKLLVDTFPNVQLIATGSSSFELANSIAEPLTGRSYHYTLYPISELELRNEFDSLEIARSLESRLRFGSYPEIINTEDYDEKKRLLNTIKTDYLLTDILKLERIKGSDTLYKLLQLLALQIGSEFSLDELATNLGIDRNTVKKYIDLLEKCFIVFRLAAFSRNLRKEVVKKDKIYFYDLGIRNALINNYNSPDLRQDKGQLWENYLVSERLKRNRYTRIFSNMYFWRTYDRQEIDLIEERDGNISAFEFKWQKGAVKKPAAFKKAYPNVTIETVNKDNFHKFVT